MTLSSNLAPSKPRAQHRCNAVEPRHKFHATNMSRSSAQTQALLKNNAHSKPDLSRSLNRCDVELAAVDKLNKSLLALRDDPDKEFEWKMLLRRRLLNRLARRLNRLAHIKDGEMVVPPALPRYGDTPFFLEQYKDEFEAFRKQCMTSSDKKNVETTSPDTSGETMEEEKPVEIEYDVGYEIVPAETDDELEQRLRYTTSNLSDREKVTEFKRWRAELVQKIPSQCTFDDVEPDFEAEIERYVWTLVEKKEVEEEQEKQQNVATDDNDNIDDKETLKSPSKKPKRDLSTVVTTLRKPFSLKAVPSFYNQDWNRILTLHQHTLETYTKRVAQQKAAVIITEYNTHLRKSNEICAHQLKLRNDLQKVLLWAQNIHQNNTQQQQQQIQFQQLQRQYAMDLQIARQRFDVYRNNLDLQQRNKRKHMEEMAEKETKHQNLGNFVQLSVGATLMSIVDSIEMRYGQSAQQQSNANTNANKQPMLGATLISAVTNVIRAVTRNGAHPDTPYLAFNPKNPDPYMLPKFVPPRPPPPPSTDNNTSNNAKSQQQQQQVAQIEQRTRTDYNRITQLLQQSETERVKSWQKLLKIKAEYEPTDVRRRVVLSQPMPPVKSAPLPMNLSAHYPEHMYSSNPNLQLPRSGNSKNNDSKVSVVNKKGRMYPDGSVAPSVPPVKGEDGLYVRPSGNQCRQGMKWDATRGRWVPMKVEVTVSSANGEQAE